MIHSPPLISPFVYRCSLMIPSSPFPATTTILTATPPPVAAATRRPQGLLGTTSPAILRPPPTSPSAPTDQKKQAVTGVLFHYSQFVMVCISEGVCPTDLRLHLMKLAGILLDRNNLSKKCSNRDSETVQLLLYVMLDHNDHSFIEYLKNTYRKSSTDGDDDSPPDQKHSISASGSSQYAKKSNSTNQRSARGNGGKASDEAPHGENNFFLAKWFGFGSK